MTNKMVKLKNGTEAPEPLVKATMAICCNLFNEEDNLITLHDLIRICLNEKVMDEGSLKKLLELGLILKTGPEKYQTSSVEIKNIVLSSIHGKEKSFIFDWVPRDPIAK